MAEVQREDVEPVAAGVERPLWSVMVPTYNSARYLEETLASVLAQDPGPERMQIEVVDDCSTRDDPAALVERLGKGRVGFYRQPANVGHSRNFNTCLQRAQGHLVHILHGDDRVLDGFYSKMQSAFEADREIGAAFCLVTVIDEDGKVRFQMPPLQPTSGRVDDVVRVMAIRQPVETPAIVVRREVYERLGGFDPRLRSCGEDLEMWVRIAAHYPIWHEAEPLALYRTHAQSLSGMSFQTGQNIRDLRLAIDTFRSYLPPQATEEITPRAREEIALWALNIAKEASWKGNPVVARAQLREALQCSRSAPVLLAALEVALSGLRRRVRRITRRIKNLPVRFLPWHSSSRL